MTPDRSAPPSMFGPVVLLLGLALALPFAYFRTTLDALLAPQFKPVPTSALDGCAPPATEHEQLHVVLAWRNGHLVQDGCLYVGSQSAYVKPRRSAHAHAQD